jgi:carbonic anhydrase
MLAGNERFVSGDSMHPNQNAHRRSELVNIQSPFAVIFGCADSRLAAEIIFDVGLGDVFVVRTAGHVIDDAVLGSLEYAVSVLHVPLIVVLRHDNCRRRHGRERGCGYWGAALRPHPRPGWEDPTVGAELLA